MQTSATTQSPFFISNLLISTALTRSVMMLTLATAGTLAATPALAIDALETPMGGNVVGGSATITSGLPGQLTINQSSDRAVINWDSFNIGHDATTEFVQPGVTSLAVNRVTGVGQDPTQILGTLRANGRVMVLDRNGVVFGKDARVDVGGIVASTGDVDSAAVMSGSDRLVLTNSGNGTVANHGRITAAEGGLAALVAPNVINDGVITARVGRVALASGDKVTLDLYGDNLIEMEVSGTAQHAAITQSGTINAEGGLVQISASTAKGVVDNVVNLDGVTTVSSVSQRGGRIVLSGGTVNVRGTVNANGRQGGSVRTDAERLDVASTANVTADSTAGEAAGRIDLLASESASFEGTVSARGAQGTGFIDTSAPAVNFGATASVLSTGEWLIDPLNITIGPVLEFLIEAQLLFGNATVDTPAIGFQAGNIVVESTINWFTNNSLTFNAHNDIIFNNGSAGLANTGAGNIILNAGRNVQISNGNGISTNGGDITVNSQRFKLTATSVNAHGGDIAINNTGGFQALANSIRTSGTGTITLHQNKDGNAFLSSNLIQNAINAIQNTGTGTNRVIVGAGTWNEAVVVDRTLWLESANNAGISGIGARGAETVISTAGNGVTVTASNAKVKGLKVDGAANGIVVNAATGVELANNVVVNTTARGISVENASTSANIHDNLVHHTGTNGISVTDSNSVTAQSNVVHTTGANAISFVHDKFSRILANYVGYTDAGVTSAGAFNIKGDGILVDRSTNTAGNHTIIQGNYVTDTKSMAWDNGSGIAVTGSRYVDVGGLGAGEANFTNRTNWDGVRVQSTQDSTVVGNTLTNQTRSGIYLGSSNRIVADNNTITGNTSHFGVHGDNSANLTVSNNIISDIFQDGVFFEKGTGTNLIDTNTISNTGDDGVAAITTNNLTVRGNIISGTNGNGIDLSELTGATVIDGNSVDDTGSDGIFTSKVNNMIVSYNLVGLGKGSINGDGIFVTKSDNTSLSHTVIKGNTVTNTLSPAWDKGSGIQVTGSDFVDIGGAGADANTIYGTAWDGIRVESVLDADIYNNSITNVARSGMYLGSGQRLSARENTIDGTGTHFGIDAYNNTDVSLTGNIISNTFQDAIYMHSLKGTNVANANIITNAGTGGITAENVTALELGDNTITTAGTTGISVSGKLYDATSIHGNTITDAPVGMELSSGLIDMTGDTNFINNGDVGLRFIGTNVDLLGDTIGTTTFTGQSTYYVELLRGALFAPGSPTLEDGVNATYDGLNPAAGGGFITPLQAAALEGKFWHFNDDATVGLFFFGTVLLPVATFQQEDAFNSFSAFNPAAGRVSLRVTGLPKVPGGGNPNPPPAPDFTNPESLNSLSPAAGGNNEQEPTSPEQLAALAPAAGGNGQSAKCWSDVVSLTSGGQAANYDFTTDPQTALSDANACGSPNN